MIWFAMEYDRLMSKKISQQRAYRRYRQSEKGRARDKRYRESEKGQEALKRSEQKRLNKTNPEHPDYNPGYHALYKMRRRLSNKRYYSNYEVREKKKKYFAEYQKTEKYRESRKRYKQSEKGKETARRWEQSVRGKEARARAKDRKKAKEKYDEWRRANGFDIVD